MKIIKIILVVIASLLALLLIVALFTKKEYQLEREITINKPEQEVFNYIKYVKNSDHYSKWGMMDPAMQKTYSGTDGSVGFVYAWDSKNKQVGKGEQEIKEIIDGERIEYEVRFIEPMEGKADAYMATEAVTETQTKVTWGVASGMKYPMNIMLLFIDIEGLLGNDLQEGLTNLKDVLENE